MDQKVKVYLSILHTGWVRHELAWYVLPKIQTDKNHEVYIEPLSFSLDRDKYIFSNRNRIVKRFLATSFDYLLMIDADTVPLFNPLELVDFGCDVIAAPERLIDNHRLIWSAWRKSGDDLIEIEIEEESDAAVRVDAVGSGCIAIKRDLLMRHEMENPFAVEVDENGILKTGADINFCRRAKKEDFEVWTTTKLICEHFKEVPLHFGKKWGAIL
jgi:hypothetical protein